MARFLVLQLARLGDLLQTRRLLSGLAAQAKASGGEVHLAVDSSLTALAEKLYPPAVVHGLPAHGRASAGDAAGFVFSARDALSNLAAIPFDRVFCLNFSPMGMAVSAMFPPEVQRGYRQFAGQTDKDRLLRLFFRLTRDRRGGGINLADLWAHLDDVPLPPATVNPPARPGGGGLGVALAGRMARRSLPPEILAPLVRTLFRSSGAGRIVLLGTAGQAGEARALLRQMAPAEREACVDLTGKTDLAGLCEVVGGLDRLVTPDTGAMHLAAFYGIPVTALFLSSAWCHETGPYGVGHQVVQAVTPCAPCLESAPCDHGLICRPPFADPTLVRLLAGSSKVSPPANLALFTTDCDGLGTCCRLVAGHDPTVGAREALRSFMARHFGVAGAFEATGPVDGAALAERYYMETDWVLPPPGRPWSGEW